MGKTKTKIMDDSVVTEETLAKGQSSSGRKKLGRQDDLVEKLKAEFADVGADKEQVDTGNLKLDLEAGKSKVEKEIQPQPSNLKKPASSIQHPSSKKIRSKKYQEVAKDMDKSKSYPLNEAIELTKKSSYTKFEGTLEAHINTVHAGIRGLVSLPYASGKKLRILAFGPKGSLKEEDGVTIGDESTIEEINKGRVNFDLVITTPEWMPKLAKIARILGPRGLMPNPKNGTITDDLKKAVEGFQAGKTEYKTEAKIPVIHLGLGKLNQPTQELSANIKILLQTLGKSRVKKVTLSPTMGPSVKLDLSSL